jgi:Fic family protein
MNKTSAFRSPEPLFSSRVTDLVIELEHLRREEKQVTTDPFIYNQFRQIFRDLDAMSSARIDGNKTGLSKYFEAKDDEPEAKGRKAIEIDKVSEAMKLIDSNFDELHIFQGFITELHRIIRDGITNESSRFAGKFRHGPARPDVPGNTSPQFHLVETYLDKLISYINKKDHWKYDAIKSAMVHQKFLWIHPFREANGLMARILTYIILKKQGFNSRHDRIINPAFICASDPDKYIRLLRKADSEKEKEVNDYLEFFLDGLRQDIIRMDKLFDYQVIKDEILIPAFKHPLFDRVFSDQDRLIINVAIEKQLFQAADIRLLFPQKHPTEISRMLKWLRDKDMIINTDENARKYAINLENKYLVKFIVGKLERAGFIPFS